MQLATVRRRSALMKDDSLAALPVTWLCRCPSPWLFISPSALSAPPLSHLCPLRFLLLPLRSLALVAALLRRRPPPRDPVGQQPRQVLL